MFSCGKMHIKYTCILFLNEFGRRKPVLVPKDRRISSTDAFQCRCLCFSPAPRPNQNTSESDREYIGYCLDAMETKLPENCEILSKDRERLKIILMPI